MKLAAVPLETRRLRLRTLVPDDARGMHAIYGDEETMRHWSDGPSADLDETRRRLAADLAFARSGGSAVWGVVLKDSDELIGKCTLFQFSAQNRRAEIGYILNRAHWGKGVMSEVCGELLRHAFEDLGLHRLEADTDPANAASIALLERLGFCREGYFPERWYVGETWHDSIMFGLLRSRWAARHRAGDPASAQAQTKTAT